MEKIKFFRPCTLFIKETLIVYILLFVFVLTCEPYTILKVKNTCYNNLFIFEKRLKLVKLT